MKKGKINLDNMQVARSCSTDWQSMTGDEKTRFCNECRKNVYNISAMSRYEVEDLIRDANGKFCARIVRDSYGAVITAPPSAVVNLFNPHASKFATALVTAVLSLGNPVAANSSQMNGTNGIRLLSQKIEKSPQENTDKNQLPSSTVLKGTVFDFHKAVIAGAKIKLSNETTKEVFTTVSSEDGTYTFKSLPVGSYSIEIDTNAFVRFKAKGIELREGQEIDLETTLQVARMGEVVDVITTAPPSRPSMFRKLFKLTPDKTKQKN